MAGLVQRIYDHCHEALATIEPCPNDYAKREHHRQEYLRSVTDLRTAIISALRHAEDLENAVAAAIEDGAHLGYSSQDLYKERSKYKVEELQARLHLTQLLSNRHIVASEIAYSDETTPGYLESDYKKVKDNVRAVQVCVDEALDAVMVATSKLTQAQPGPNVAPEREKNPIKPNTILQPAKFTGEDPSKWPEFLEAYRLWFKISKLYTCDQDEQAAYFKTSVAKELYDKALLIAPDNVHFNPLLEKKGSFFDVFEKSLDTSDPLRARRQEWFDMKPESNEKPLDFLVRLNKKEEDAKVRLMTADEVKVMKRIHTLTQHKDLIRDILKIEVSENNPLTTEKIFRRVSEWTKIEAEISNHSNTYEEAYLAKRPSRWNQSRRRDSRQVFHCKCCNKQLQGGFKHLCDKCFREGPPRHVYCPICKISENHTKDACTGKPLIWPSASPWKKAQRLSGRQNENGRQDRSSSGNRQRPERKKNKPRRTRFSKRAAMATKIEDGYSTDNSVSDWDPQNPTENSSDDDKSSHAAPQKVCHMVLTHTQADSSEPDSDPDEVKHYEDLPFEATSDDDTEASDLEQNKGELWYCQATKTWRSGPKPQEEVVNSPVVNQWRSHNEDIHSSSSSDSDDSQDFDSIEPAFYNCQKNDCPGSPGVQGCTAYQCQLDPIEVEDNSSDSGSEMEAVMELNDSKNFNLTLNDIAEEDEDMPAQVHMALAKPSYHVVTSLPKTSHNLDNMEIELKADDSVQGYIKLYALPDTGASTNIISLKLAHKLNLNVDTSKTEPIQVADGEMMPTEGESYAICKKGRCTKIVTFTVAKYLCQTVLIGRETLKDLEIIPRNFPEQLPRDEKRINCHPMKTRSKSKWAIPNVDKIPAPREFIKRVKNFYEKEEAHAVFLSLSQHKLEPTQADFDNLKKELLEKFPENFVEGAVTTRINAKPTTIELKKDAPLPTKCVKIMTIPVHKLEACIAAFKQYVDAGVVERVTDSSPLCLNPTFFVDKDQGRQRLITDFSELNKVVLTTPRQFPSIKNIVEQMPADAKYHIVFDLKDGFYQQKLTKKSSLLTGFTLSAQMDRYAGSWVYKSLPQGLRSSPDHFNEITDHYLTMNGAIKDCRKVMDDILISSPDFETLRERALELMKRLKAGNVKLSRQKIQIGRSVKYVGLRIIENQVLPDENRIRPLLKLKPPKSVSEVRGFLGYVNALSIWNPNLAIKLKAIHELTKKNVEFTWTEHHQRTFDDVIKELISQIRLTSFDMKKKTVVVTDTSKLNGTAATLFQIEDDNKMTLIGCHSRVLRDNEKNWSATELELLALVFACQQFHYYLFGMPHFEIWTDHSALTSIMKQSLDKMPNQRIFNLRDMCKDYNFTTKYVPGGKGVHYLIDQLSRHPMPLEEHNDVVNVCIQNSLLNISPENPDPIIDKLKQLAQNCIDYQQQIEFIRSDSKYKDLPDQHPARQFSEDMINNISIENNLLLFHGKICVPLTARKWIISILHSAHAGKDSMQAEAKRYYYWANMAIEIAEVARSCIKCIENSGTNQQQPEKLNQGRFPGEIICLDPFEIDGCKKTFLGIVDSYSGFPWCCAMPDGKTTTIIKNINQFIDWTNLRPLILQSDSGRPFISSEYRSWCKSMNITPQLSSPHHQQSNGGVESHIKQLKRYIIEHNGQIYGEKFRNALNRFRNHVSTRVGKSRHEMLYAYPGRTDLPILHTQITPVDREEAMMRKIENRWSSKRSYDKHSKQLSQLRPNQRVLVQDMKLGRTHKKYSIKGTVSKPCENKQDSYYIQLDSGPLIQRNRVHLKLIHKAGKAVRFV